MSKTRSGAPRRVAAGLLAGALAVFGVALAPPAGAIDDVTTDRVAGPTRYSTAGAIAGQEDFNGATTAILATGENFPDALAASGLAGANAPAPIILTETNTFTDAARIAMTQVESLTDVLVVGGTAAVSDEVVQQVEDDGYTVTRIAGTDRYETAAEIAGEVVAGEIDGLTTALIASGEVFADAVAGGPIAYAGQLPILLVNTEGVPAATEAALNEAGIEQVILLGGTARITDETETELEGMVGNDAIRVAGVDRFETAADIGRFAEATFGWAPNELLLANGLNFPDALACGPLGGERSAPIVLTASIPEPTAAYIDEVSDTLEKITACGGTAAVSEEDLTAAETLGETTDNDAPTGGNTQTSELTGPELQDCVIGGVDFDDLEVVISYVFDADIDDGSIDESGFKLYNADTRNPATGDMEGIDADVSGDTVDITFSLLDYGVLDAKLCAVEAGAVTDEDGNENPPQSIEANGSGSGTQGADLIGAEVTDEDEDGVADEVTFTFDSETTIAGKTFSIVREDGDAVTCTSPETSPEDDEASTEITATCAIPDGNDAVRGIVTISGLNGQTVVQAADIARGGNSDAPDLVSVTTSAGDSDLDDDEVIFTFDEDIDSPAIGNTTVIESFRLYNTHCNPSPGSGFNLPNPCVVRADSIEFDEDEDRQVIARFPDNAVNEFNAGAFVLAGAVTDTDADAATTNQADEVRLSEEDPFEAGEVAGPQLVDASVTIDYTASGAFDDYEVRFEFDKDLDEDTLTDSNFLAYIDDEGETETVDLANCEVDDDRTVLCTDEDEDSDLANVVVLGVNAGAVETDDVFALAEGQLAVQFPNPEGSVAVDAAGTPEGEEA